MWQCSFQRKETTINTYSANTYSAALITGASSGIGEAFARLLAAQGTDLVLVARSDAKLQLLAEELAARHRVRADVIAADLSAPGAARQVHEEVTRRGLAVDLLVNSAGFGSYGVFDTLPLERESQEIALNVTALVELTHLFLPEMLSNKSGAIINVASTAAFQPVPYMAVYAATKAFVLSFSESLWAECRTRGVRVLAFCPGPVDTGFAAAAGFDVAAGPKLTGQGATASGVAAAAVAALAQGRSYVVPGRENYWLSVSSRFAPRSLVARLAERKMRPSRPDNLEEQSEPATGLGLVNKNAVDSRSGSRSDSRSAGALAVGAAAVGALAVGALAIGTLAVGTMAVKQLAIGKSRIRSLKIDKLEIDELVIRRLTILEQVLPTEAR